LRRDELAGTARLTGEPRAALAVGRDEGEVATLPEIPAGSALVLPWNVANGSSWSEKRECCPSRDRYCPLFNHSLKTGLRDRIFTLS
jgi:hypothetical protein